MIGSGSFPYTQDFSPVIMVFVKWESLLVMFSMSCESWVLPVTRHFPYENPMRVLNTNSLNCYLSSTDAIDRRETIHLCVWRFKVASCKRASFKSTRCSKKNKSGYLTEYTCSSFVEMACVFLNVTFPTPCSIWKCKSFIFIDLIFTFFLYLKWTFDEYSSHVSFLFLYAFRFPVISALLFWSLLLISTLLIMFVCF